MGWPLSGGGGLFHVSGIFEIIENGGWGWSERASQIEGDEWRKRGGGEKWSFIDGICRIDIAGAAALKERFVLL